jgi:predicted acetyltransferase
MPPSLSFLKIGSESEAVLRKLCQHYLRDMAEWFEVETNPDGRYAYDISAIWEKGYQAFLAKVDDSAAGFALVGSADEWLGEVGADVDAYDVHEFFVLRRFRRGGVGQHMANHIWNEHAGVWLVRVLEANAPALAFWRAVIANRTCKFHEEEARLVKGRPWVFFRFTSGGSVRPRS